MQNAIYKFPLVWRWTQPSHNVLPDDILAQLHPLDIAAATRLDRQQHDLFDGSKLKRDMFYSLQKHDVSMELPLSFFVLLGIDDDTPVRLSWDSRTALRTTWRIFREYWDDFCYPSSDDLTVVPADESWLLFYFHHELFEFGRMKTNINT